MAVREKPPIIPRAVAEGVWEEVCVWLDQELPREWIRRLAIQADVIYARNPRFRRRLRHKGNAGRDYLWMFTRHWLAAMIHRHNYDLYVLLPASFSVGGDLPVRRHERAE